MNYSIKQSNFLKGVNRLNKLLYNDDCLKILKNSPLKYAYVHSKRQATWKDDQPFDARGKKWTTTMCLAWFVWNKEYNGEPIIRFI